MEDIVGIHNLDTGIGTAGVGFVVIPSDTDRNQYIEDCYRTNTLTINGGRGYGFISGIHVDSDVMQSIHFPTDEDNRGTPVIWVRDSISQLPVIVGVIRQQNRYYPLAENQYRLKRGVDKRIVEFFIDGNESSLDITIVGDKEEPANVNIKVNSENSDSVINITCDNEVNLIGSKHVTISTNEKLDIKVKDKGDDKMSLSYELNKGLFYTDEFGNEITTVEGCINVISKKINHNSGAEPMVLGNTLVDLLSDFLSAVQKLTVVSPVGVTSVPVNTSEFANIQAKLDTIKSKISNLE